MSDAAAPTTADLDQRGPRELLACAVRIAEGAAALVARGQAHARDHVSTKSSPTDVVTEIDKASETYVIQELRAVRPYDGVLGEEGGERAGSSGVRWILDPVDGTVNLLYGIPAYAVSLAAEVDGVVVAAVVHNVPTGEVWTATLGGGAFLDGEPIHGSGATELGQALVGTGFGYTAERRRWQAEILLRILPAVRDIRRIGSAAIDLCYCADGRLDGHYEIGLNPWDFAAAALIAAEAGLLVTGLDGAPASPDLVIAAPPLVHRDLHDRLAALLR
ncbi:inositol monophosphatase family protein [Fodinicola feengrottensis]|uniref:Inositol-1-monophosphatase n=1 Tax=Fodinicola feengrottensis TaxID=435914 RepID=A0ABN2J476_9ACTN|nr:inositol monophosphatase family protein [Fodinicola feengrottensis]